MFDKELAQRALDFFPNYLRHTKGEWNNVPFTLLPWQSEIISKVFGTLKPNGKRQYTTVFVFIPKKDGKSELAAGVALKLLFQDNEPGAEIYGAASDRDQAGIVFHVAMEMIKKSKVLSQKCKILESTKRVIHNNGSFYRVLSADAFSKHGYNIHGLIFDELHTQRNRELYDTLTEMAGDARSQPLNFIITTAGSDMMSICHEVYEYARMVRDGLIIDPSFLPIIYEANKDDDWTSEETWKKCNPSYGIIIDPEKVKKACKEAQDVPAKENNFKRLRLNLWTEAKTRWISDKSWKLANRGKVDPEKLKGRKCCAGLDLSAIIDISAWTLCFRPEEEGGEYQFLHKFFVPEKNIVEREKRDKVPYSVWIKKGWITATPGNAVDYDFIRAQIFEDAAKYDIKEIGVDPWNAYEMIAKLQEEKFEVVELRQGYGTMSPMAKDFEVKLLSGELEMGNNPVMSWMMACTEIMTDPAGNIKPVKPARDRSSKRIDGVVSSIMALFRAVADNDKDSVYKERGLRSVDSGGAAAVEPDEDRRAKLKKRGMSDEAIDRIEQEKD